MSVTTGSGFGGSGALVCAAGGAGAGAETGCCWSEGASACGDGKVLFLASRVSQDVRRTRPAPASNSIGRSDKNFIKAVFPSQYFQLHWNRIFDFQGRFRA